MNVVWHDRESVENIMPERAGVVLDGFYDHVCNGRVAEVERTTAGFLKQSVQGSECPTGADAGRWERSIVRQTAVQTPCEENGPFGFTDVRKPAAVQPHYTK